jgi:hypothetical protein
MRVFENKVPKKVFEPNTGNDRRMEEAAQMIFIICCILKMVCAPQSELAYDRYCYNSKIKVMMGWEYCMATEVTDEYKTFSWRTKKEMGG